MSRRRADADIERRLPTGWNEVTRRPFGMTAEQWAAIGMTRAEWEASDQQPRRRKASR